MDKNQIRTILFKNIESNIGRKLLVEEYNYLSKKITNVDFNSFKNVKVKVFLTELYDILMDDLRKMHAKSIDLHEIQKNLLSSDSDYIAQSYQAKPNDTVDSLLGSPSILQSIFNPDALLNTTYLVLDRKFQASDSDNITEFKWNISDISNSSNKQNMSLTTSKINNISSIQVMPFKLNTVDYMFNSRNRISLEMVELNKQAYIVNNGMKRYHFIFDIKPDTSGYSNLIDDISNCCTTFKFVDCIQDLTNITLKFGNPEHNLSLDLDRLYCVVSTVLTDTLLTFTQVHKCHVGDIIQLSTFTTSNVLADVNLINLINRSVGHVITAVTDLTITISVDLTTLVGIIDSNAILAYLDSKRFVINMEISYYKKN